MTDSEIVYSYTDEHGALLYQTVRKPPKTFFQRRLDTSGASIWNLHDVPRVPYHLPEVLARKFTETIFVVEGEKDVESLRSSGLCATTSVGGAAWEWPPDFVVHFSGAMRVVVIPDCDEGDPTKGTRKGREAARDRAARLRTVAEDVRILDLAPDHHDGYDVSDWFADGHTIEELHQLIESAPSLDAALSASDTPSIPFDRAALRVLLEEVSQFVRRYVVLSHEALFATTLWIFHTHALTAFDFTPYLQITSPEKRCGKTRTLEVLDKLVARPWLTAKTSSAALVRKSAKDEPTLLLDETDAAFSSDKEYAETLRGILNAGCQRGGKVSLCVGKNHDVCDFPVFGAKALAGIGKLPDTIADRSIPIELARKLKGEQVHRFRPRLYGDIPEKLRERLAILATAGIRELRTASPDLPDELSDRAQDVWEPLLAIADAASLGVEARAAAIKLSKRSATDEEDMPLRCLRDVRAFFTNNPDLDRVSSIDLVTFLGREEDGQYGTFRGQAFDARALSKRLKRYGIHSDSIKMPPGNKSVKGYMKAWFREVWARYLGPAVDTSVVGSDVDSPYTGNIGGIGGSPFNIRDSSVVEGGGDDTDDGSRDDADHRDHRDHRYSEYVGAEDTAGIESAHDVWGTPIWLRAVCKKCSRIHGHNEDKRLCVKPPF